MEKLLVHVYGLCFTSNHHHHSKLQRRRSTLSILNSWTGLLHEDWWHTSAEQKTCNNQTNLLLADISAHTCQLAGLDTCQSSKLQTTIGSEINCIFLHVFEQFWRPLKLVLTRNLTTRPTSCNVSRILCSLFALVASDIIQKNCPTWYSVQFWSCYCSAKSLHVCLRSHVFVLEIKIKACCFVRESGEPVIRGRTYVAPSTMPCEYFTVA